MTQMNRGGSTRSTKFPQLQLHAQFEDLEQGLRADMIARRALLLELKGELKQVVDSLTKKQLMIEIIDKQANASLAETHNMAVNKGTQQLMKRAAAISSRTRPRSQAEAESSYARAAGIGQGGSSRANLLAQMAAATTSTPSGISSDTSDQGSGIETPRRPPRRLLPEHGRSKPAKGFSERAASAICSWTTSGTGKLLARNAFGQSEDAWG